MVEKNPPRTSGIVAKLRGDIAARIDEIAPLIAEHARLHAALESIDEATGRRSVYGVRQPQILGALESHPGSTPGAIAQILDLHPTKVYAPLRALGQRGEAYRHDGRWFPGSAPAGD